MENFIFILILAFISWIVSIITGRNSRQIAKIPKGMGILCEPPQKRYIMYALGILVFGFVMFFSVLYIMDGAPEEARLMWILCVAISVLTLIITTLCGNIMARECVYFNRDKFQINKAFRKPKTYNWNEIQRIEGSFDNKLHLYLNDETKILTVRISMINYDIFCNVLKQNCPATAVKYYEKRIYDTPKKCILRYGSEYYLFAFMGILIMLMYLAIMLSADNINNFLEELLNHNSSEWFSIWFAPICGVVGIISLFIFFNTNIRYSHEKMILKYPFRGKYELYWKDIQKIEILSVKKREEESIKKLWIYTRENDYKVNLALLTYGKDGFMTELFHMIDVYEIPYMEIEK